MPRTHQCHICQKILSRPTILREHLRSHADERPHPCQRCGRAFTRRWDQEQHERTHTASYKFRCGDGHSGEGCSASFHRKRDLRRHRSSARCRKPMEEDTAVEKLGRAVLPSSPAPARTFASSVIRPKAFFPQLAEMLAPAILPSNPSSDNTDGRLLFGIDDTRRALLHHSQSTRAQNLLMDVNSGMDLFTVMTRRTVHHPAVRHSLTAVTLLCSKLAKLGGCSMPLVPSPWLMHYSIAIDAVRKALATVQTETDADALLTAVMNFSTIESLMGNSCRAFLHLKGASCMLNLGERRGSAVHHKVIQQYLSKTLNTHRHCEAQRQHFLGALDHLCLACRPDRATVI